MVEVKVSGAEEITDIQNLLVYDYELQFAFERKRLKICADSSEGDEARRFARLGGNS